MKKKDKIFATEHLCACRTDFTENAKFSFIDVDQNEKLSDLIKYLQKIDILETPLELTSDIPGEIAAEKTVPRLLGAGFHADHSSTKCCDATAHTYFLELDKIISGGVPFVLVKDEFFPCDIVITEKTFSKYRFSCMKREYLIKSCEENGETFRQDECLKKYNKAKLGTGNKPCKKEHKEKNFLKNLRIIIDNFGIENFVVPIFPYSFYCNKLIWESFFGSLTFRQRALNNKDEICDYKNHLDKGALMAQYLEAKLKEL